MTTTDTARRVDLPGTLENLTVLDTMGKRVAWARLRRKLTQAELAKRLDKSRATIVQYEQDNILPPIDVVIKLSDLLHVSPEFVAFGRQGVDGLQNGKEIVPVSEIVMGTSSEYTNAGYALPTNLLDDFSISDNKLQVFKLTHDCTHFNFRRGDRVVVATDVVKPDRDHSTFLCRTSDGYDVVQFQPKHDSSSRLVTVVTGNGAVDHWDIDTLNIAGAVTASIVRRS